MLQFLYYLIMGFNYSSYEKPQPIPETIFNNKYIGKEFTKTDISNPEIFDVDEISRHINQGVYAYTYKIANLVRKGTDIVRDNEDFTLKLHDKISPSGGHVPIIYICDKHKDISYEISYYEMHMKDRIGMDISFPKRRYTYNDLSQVEQYFDFKRDINRLENKIPLSRGERESRL
jgi:hypothetical protein